MPFASRDPLARHYLEAQAEQLLGALPIAAAAPPLILHVRTAILVDEVRSALARTLLRDRARSIIDVAFELGYGDLETETTPGEWRARLA